MSRLRIGVVGGGMIAQVEHLPNLVALGDRFDLVGVADPSAHVRAAIAERHATTAVPTLDDLLALELDALLVATPDPLHPGAVIAGLDAGLHVFSEKPLCYTQSDAEEIIRRRDATGLVVQVGYMKRFDPNYEAMLAVLPEGGRGLRYISVDVNDPDSWPFVDHRPLLRPDDVPAGLIEDARALQRRQAAEALGMEVDGAELRGYVDPLMSGVVHTVNSVHGMLDRMGIEAGPVVGGRIWAGGASASGTVSLLDGEATWHFAQVFAPGIAWYQERYMLHFDDLAVEIQFPSPYLNHQQTAVIVRRSTGLRLDTTLVQAGYGEGFVRELEGFHDAITGAAPQRNTVEEAMRDAGLLTEVARRAIGVPA
ncbi:MAG TPA: Gfo/Idh/MocA family oxidoreductase [Gaiellales bacterium]|nr:Gfo/Idh/MocA family oxidoreductase [Gaiellales bacterium]